MMKSNINNLDQGKYVESICMSKLSKINFKTENSLLPTQTHTIENISSETVRESEKNGSKIVPRKLFRIRKLKQYNKLISDVCSDEELSDLDKLNTNQNNTKISPFSKVNFSKLNEAEKNDRLKNLAKLVKKLRRRVKNLEHKVRVNPSKLLNKFLCNKLDINTKNKYLKPEFEFDFNQIVKAMRKIRNSDEFEFQDQRNLIENLINLIAEDKLKFNSLAFKKICTLLRMLIPKEKIKFISKYDGKVTISFPDIEINVTNMEYSQLAKFQESEEIMKAIIGIETPKERTVKIFTEPPKQETETINCNNFRFPPSNNLSPFNNNGNLQWFSHGNKNSNEFAIPQNDNSQMNNLMKSLIGMNNNFVNNFNSIGISNNLNQINDYNYLNKLNNPNNSNNANLMNMFLK